MEIIIDRESFYGGEIIGGSIIFTDFNITSGAAEIKNLGVKLVQRIIRSGSRFCHETTLSYENISSHSTQLQSPLTVAKKGFRKTKKLSHRAAAAAATGGGGRRHDDPSSPPLHPPSGRTPFTLATRQDIRGTYADTHVSVEHVIVAAAKYSTGKLSGWHAIGAERRICVTPAIDADTMLEPVHVARTKRFKRLLVAACGYVEASVCTHRTGFCAGDMIDVDVSVKNTAHDPLCEVALSLRETVRLGSGKEYSRTLAQTGNLIPAERRRVQENGALATSTSIPVPLEATYSEHTGEVLVFHMLVAELRGESGKKVMSLVCPIFVATFHGNNGAAVGAGLLPPSAPPYPIINGGGGNVGMLPPFSPSPLNRDALCVICMNQVQTHCAVPCGHKCMCQACAGLAMKTGVCPMCRQNIETIIKIYD